jgi:hypothetical protein
MPYNRYLQSDSLYIRTFVYVSDQHGNEGYSFVTILHFRNAILDIIHRRFLQTELSETGFCLRIQVEPTHLCLIYT